jgi:hypothetical protein
LVSEAVHEQVKGKVDANFTVAGELRLKNIRRAVAEAVRRQADIDQKRVRRSNRYRDTGRSERVIAVLSAAGLPA